MTSFQTRITLWFCMAFVALSLAMLAGLLACAYATLKRSEAYELERLARGIAGQLAAVGDLAPDSPDMTRAIEAINDKIAFLFDEERLNLGYAIFSTAGRLQYEFSPHDPLDRFRHVPSGATNSRALLTRWRSYKNPAFYHWLRTPRFDLLVCSAHHLDLIDHLLAGFALALPLGILVSFGMGRILGARVVTPLRTIAETARRIEHGDLGARIDTRASGDEVGYVIRVLNRAFENLQSSIARIQQFSADVAHELKTPLTVMRGSMEVGLRRPRSTEEYQATLAQCVEEIAELNRFIDALLLLAQPGPADMKARFAPVDLRLVTEDVLEHLAELADSRGVAMHGQLDGGVAIAGDRTLLHRMIYNLLHNAITYSDKGGSVTVALRATAGSAELVVADTGCGIAAEHLPRIFDRLYQVDRSRHRGHGLGLAIVKWIADLHGARIDVESETGRGSTFRVRLPPVGPG